MKSLIFLIFLVQVSCASKALKEQQEAARVQDLAELSQVNNAYKALDAGRADEAYKLFTEFTVTKGHSKHWASAKFGEAEALALQGKSQEALTLLRETRDRSLSDNPPVAAKASYQMSFVYDSLGDEEKTLASLLEAQAQSEYLPEQVALAEVPARLAVIYSRMGKTAEAMAWLEKADRGLKKSIEALGFDREWIAKTYFQMGRVSTQQLGAENFLATVDAQRIVQVYHLKGMKLEDKTWSPRSKEALLANYQLLVNQLRSLKFETREEAEFKTKCGAAMSSLLDEASLYAPIKDLEYKAGEKDFFQALQKIKDTIRVVAFKSDATLTLTDEAKDRNSIRQNFNLEDPEGYTPRIAPPSDDPNL